jgi:trk system potassium uptake protein TrkH
MTKLKYIGKVLIGYSLVFILPIIVGLIYDEKVIEFVIPGLISLVLGLLLNSLKVKNNGNIYARDGFFIVSLSWIIICLIGALTFSINKDLNYIDAFFETVSGFTTTGASVFREVESLDKSILFFRSLTHFIGGMGVLVFVMALVPLSRKDKSMHLLKAEMPGPTVAKLVPGIRKTLLYLLGIYFILTLLEIIILLIFKVPLYDSIVLSFGTAGTGGFSILNDSLASYTMGAKYTVAIFMLLFGVNFNIYFLAIMGDIKNALKSEELKVYFGIYFLSVLFVIINTCHMFTSMPESILSSVFHVSSIMTSTGYSIGDVNIYPTNVRVLMMLLMLISACAGSTCGGFKVSRLIIGFKVIKRDLKKLVHPNSVHSIRFEGKKLSEETITSTTTFLMLYCIIIILLMFIVSFDGFSLETTMNAVFTTFANVGLCFNISNFSEFSNLSKIVLSIGMLLGRLEIFPFLALATDIYKK